MPRFQPKSPACKAEEPLHHNIQYILLGMRRLLRPTSQQKSDSLEMSSWTIDTAPLCICNMLVFCGISLKLWKVRRMRIPKLFLQLLLFCFLKLCAEIIGQSRILLTGLFYRLIKSYIKKFSERTLHILSHTQLYHAYCVQSLQHTYTNRCCFHLFMHVPLSAQKFAFTVKSSE
jgi:hypothetical protein